MQQLKLKSEITKSCPFDSIDISAFIVPLKADEARYEQDIKKFCRKFAVKVNADDAAEDDMVTLSCDSENPKFQKKSITLRLGLGLYSKELEEKICGMKAGESRKITAEGDAVTVDLLSCEREIIPPLTDDLALKCADPDIKTAEDIKEYCRFKQYDDIVDEHFDDAYSFFSKELLSRSEFSFKEEEIQASLSEAKKSMSPNAQSNVQGEDFDIAKFTQKLAKSMLIAAVLGQEMASVTEEDYEEYLEKTALASECSIEEARRSEPVLEYLIFTYSDIFIEKTEKYVMNRLKREGETLAGNIRS